MKHTREGFVYWKDEDFIHIENQWLDAGKMQAERYEIDHRYRAWQATADKRALLDPLCPACYMLVAYNMLVHLAQQNGQDLQELGRTMAKLFTELADHNPPNEDEMSTFPFRQQLQVIECEGGACSVTVGNPTVEGPPTNKPREIG